MEVLKNILRIMLVPHSYIMILHSANKAAALAAYSDHVRSDIHSFRKAKI